MRRKSRIVFAPNWLGDCVMAFPVLRALRRSEPESGLAVLARTGAACLFRAEGSSDSVLPRSGFSGDVGRLFAGGFSEAWILPNSFRSALIPFLARIPERIGYDTDRRGALLTNRVPPPLSTEHQLRDYDLLLRSRGIEPDLEAPHLPITPETSARAASILEKSGLPRGGPLALLAPGAAFGWTKRWPPDRYGRLASLLSERGFSCAVVIGPGEEELAGRVAAAAKEPLPILGADLDPLELAALLSRARVVIANDSGPMHLAAAVGTPIVAFFGPTDPARTNSTGAPSRVLDRYVFCSPCYLKECPYGHECMREILPEDALRAVQELVSLSF